eukprot:142917_1
MAAQIDCELTAGSFGENEGDKSQISFEEWLISRKIKQHTAEKLIEYGIDSKYILAQCDANDVEQLSQYMEHKLQFKDKIIIKGLIAELKELNISNHKPNNLLKTPSIKLIPVCNEEEKAMIKIENKLFEIKDKILMNNKITKNITQTQQECSKQIEIIFDQLYNALNYRKQTLLNTINSLSIKQQNIVNNKQQYLQQNQNEIE